MTLHTDKASAPRRIKMVEWTVTPFRALIGLPLAWGAKAHADMCQWDLSFCRPLRVRGFLCALTGRAAFFFRGIRPDLV
jgi:hypothetical protein